MPGVAGAPKASVLLLFRTGVDSDRIPTSASSGLEERTVRCSQSAGRLAGTWALHAAGEQDSDATACVWCCVCGLSFLPARLLDVAGDRTCGGP